MMDVDSSALLNVRLWFYLGLIEVCQVLRKSFAKNKKPKTNQKPNTVLITKCSKVIQLPCTLLMMQSKPRVSPQKTSA